MAENEFSELINAPHGKEQKRHPDIGQGVQRNISRIAETGFVDNSYKYTGKNIAQD